MTENSEALELHVRVPTTTFKTSTTPPLAATTPTVESTDLRQPPVYEVEASFLRQDVSEQDDASLSEDFNRTHVIVAGVMVLLVVMVVVLVVFVGKKRRRSRNPTTTNTTTSTTTAAVELTTTQAQRESRHPDDATTALCPSSRESVNDDIEVAIDVERQSMLYSSKNSSTTDCNV